MPHHDLTPHYYAVGRGYYVATLKGAIYTWRPADKRWTRVTGDLYRDLHHDILFGGDNMDPLTDAEFARAGVPLLTDKRAASAPVRDVRY